MAAELVVWVVVEQVAPDNVYMGVVPIASSFVNRDVTAHVTAPVIFFPIAESINKFRIIC